ncbi:class I SAM-dependent methyltransferase [Bacillus luteolus]|uniref:Class I SAM-dependent methyltransferase n=1 Tax=Litchfieldia luteola TaxID=682179 RepID=A0ABR9QNU1_9BACI|nr:class I SAM-dependent methyltransferase [Cytobacillus luteolus]MBE4910163.1 class I SAM-dependent methyltransferase [Cytobacillus luteolus]MBP1942271.1 ubiquinone/menaquinone biosynthesis C-methylase UbiE [Cytobacillus luteolus]
MENNNWHKEVEKQWDNRANFWNQNSENMWEKGSRSTIIPFLKRYLQPEMNILDAGCGDGYGSYKLYQEGFNVTGVDISKEMIERAKLRLESKRLHYKQADLSDLPFDAETFSAVMAINSLEWTANPLKAINECSRILKPNGILCVGLLGPTAGPRQNAYRRLYGEDVICNTMMPWEFQQLVMENGFEVIDGQGVYKNAVDLSKINHYPLELKQALTFMWVFILKKKG